MLDLSFLRRNGFRRIESLLSSSPNRAITVQRVVQARKSSFLSEIDALSNWEPPPPTIQTPTTSPKFPHSSLAPEAEVSDDTSFLKRSDSLWKVGAYVSAARGIENAVTNAISIGANSFAPFLKSPFRWSSPSLTPQAISEFKKRMKQYGYANNMVLPYGNYFINLGNPNSDMRKKSYECLLDDLQRCEALDLELYRLLPGPVFGTVPTERSLTLIVDGINWAHNATKNVTIVLENMDGGRGVFGSKFSDLAKIIAEVKDEKRIGVSLDTYSAYAAGYDIKTKEGWDATMNEFDKEIGLNYLRGMRLSDSITSYNSKKELHQNIGLGHLGITAFHHILQDPRTQNIPLILATPGFKQPKAVWGKEIAVLQALTNNSSAIKSEEYLQSLVHGLMSAVQEAKSLVIRGKQQKKQKGVLKSGELTDSVVDNSVVDRLAESAQTSQRNDRIVPELQAKRRSPRNWKPTHSDIWQNYLT